MSGKKSNKNIPSKKTEKDNSEDEQLDDENELVALIEITDGNCLKQTVEFFRATTTVIPLVFYRDRLEILRANYDSTLVNRAVFGRKEFILKYQVNEELFNEPDHETTIRKHNGEFDEDGSPIIIEETIKDPRHVFVTEMTRFYKQCKSIARKDGFQIAVYLNSTTGKYCAKAYRISSNSATSGNTIIKAENVEDYKDYTLNFVEPRFALKANQKIRLVEFCSVCSEFSRLETQTTSLMSYAEGFRMKNAGQDYKWGTFTDSKKKGKIRIKGEGSKHDYFGVPSDFIKALSKLQTIAGNGGVCSIYSHAICLQFIIPIGIVGEFIITLIPPDVNEEKSE
jgi:hypothetical protein